jgi:hypothetical protein
MGFVITNPLIPQFKNEEERNNFIANHTPGELRKLGFFGRSICGYNAEMVYGMEEDTFISSLHPVPFRELGFFGRSMCGYNDQLDYNMDSTKNTKHRLFGDT